MSTVAQVESTATPMRPHLDPEAVERLRARLAEAEETLRAIREGTVDALLVDGGLGDAERQVYTLSSAERPYRVMIEQMSEGASTLGDDGAIVYGNRRLTELLGLPLDKILGRPLEDFITADSRENLEGTRTPEAPWRAEVNLRHADGTEVPVLVSGTTVDVEGLKTQCVVLTDLTARKSQELLEERARRLTAADRQKDEFLAMLGHELRNPLSPIHNAVHILESHPVIRASAELSYAVDVITRQSAHLRRLVDDLLDVARIIRGRFDLRKEKVNLKRVLIEATEASRPLIAERQQTLNVEIAERLPPLDADPVRLAQVFWNLLDNAAKYSPPNSVISLWTKVDDSRVSIHVKDAGRGIPADVLPFIFEPFHQAQMTLDRTQGGLGLGLTIVRRIVELHGGRMRAESEGEGRGSEFVVELPVERPAVKDMKPSIPEVADGRRRILVVDDSRDAADTLAILLRHKGHDVRVAHTSHEALALLSDFTPEVAFLDIGLPEMNGYELATHIREQLGERTPFLVAVTGYAQEEDRRHALSAGFNLHFSKPISIADLFRVLGTAAGN
jgi:PAS domain S-box-containing protein